MLWGRVRIEQEGSGVKDKDFFANSRAFGLVGGNSRKKKESKKPGAQIITYDSSFWGNEKKIVQLFRQTTSTPKSFSQEIQLFRTNPVASLLSDSTTY